MNDIYSYLRELVARQFAEQYNLDYRTIYNSSFVIERPKREDNGDISTNICMVNSKMLKIKPLNAAKELAEKLRASDDFEKIEVASPGFINFWTRKTLWHKFLSLRLKTNELVPANIGSGKNVNVEYVSANPTGPLHIGHCRGAVYGDVLANLLEKTGHKVTREYYVNDAGIQISQLVSSVIIRINELLINKISEDYPENFYPGEYLIDVARHILNKHGNTILDNKDHLDIIRQETIEFLLNRIKSDLTSLSINQDLFVSEQSLIAEGKIDDAINRLKDMDMIYRGTLEKPKGKEIEDWEPREQLLFRSTKFGDEIDRPLQKSSGEWTYFANDIAYHFDKIQRGSNHLIDILGADHGGYVKRMNASVKALTNNKAEFTAKLCQMVKLVENGKHVKMSKRSGEFITLKEMVDRVGSDSIRFMMMYRKNEAPLEFDVQKVTEQSKDNPVFYVQYAHARISSVINKLKKTNMNIDLTNFDNCNFSLLDKEGEIELIKILLDWKSVIETAVNLYEPHRISYYLYDLSSSFHSLWNQGKIDKNNKFIDEERPEISNVRIALLIATQETLKSGLNLIGVSAPDEMQ